MFSSFVFLIFNHAKDEKVGWTVGIS
uniref:Uncharacterized protein n=1 Tax=Rhizophora mucronata TaxID=61149 RepID=A0A2P2NEY2_RHIMU